MDMKVGREMCIEIFELFLNTLLALGREHVLNEGKYFFSTFLRVLPQNCNSYIVVIVL